LQGAAAAAADSQVSTKEVVEVQVVSLLEILVVTLILLILSQLVLAVVVVWVEVVQAQQEVTVFLFLLHRLAGDMGQEKILPPGLVDLVAELGTLVAAAQLLDKDLQAATAMQLMLVAVAAEQAE
jgi:hypothetical protein